MVDAMVLNVLQDDIYTQLYNCSAYPSSVGERFHPSAATDLSLALKTDMICQFSPRAALVLRVGL